MPWLLQFFLDAKTEAGDFWYREQFQGADPLWNVTGSGGTNAACLAATPKDEQWKCLMVSAPFPLALGVPGCEERCVGRRSTLRRISRLQSSL